MSTAVASPALLSDDRSLAELLIEPAARLQRDERSELVETLCERLSDDELAVLLSWHGQARPSQRIDPRGDATFVGLVGGRGSGKTRAGAEAICDRIESDELHHGGFISRTPGDVRRVMIEGESGFLACAERRGIRAVHQPSLAQLRIVGGGTITTYSAQEPDSLRGPQHDTLWADEFAAWPRKTDAMGNNAFSNAVAGLRLGNPLGVFTTTPKAVPEVREMLTDTTGLWRVSRMTTWANAAHLAPGFLATLRRLYGGTRLAAQEFEGLFVEDVEGALWSSESIETTRVQLAHGESWRDRCPELPWRYVAVDPSVAQDGGGDECGIVGGGVGVDRRLYVVADESMSGSPRAWAERALWLYHDLDASCIVAEGNNGGALVSEVLGNLDPTVPVELVHARNAKRARAEPIAMLWQGDDDSPPLGSIVGSLPSLEAEMTGWDARTLVSPNRLDALAWLGHQCLDHLFEFDGGWSAEAASLRLPV